MINKLFFLIVGCAFAAGLISCESDSVEVGELEKDQWLYPYGASETDKVLQEAFYSQNGIYLLFNDTLKKEQTGVNPDGTPFYEVEDVDLAYYMTGVSNNVSDEFHLEYLLADAEKNAAKEFVQNYILPHLGDKLRPFSLLLVNGIEHIYANSSTGFEKALETLSVYAGYRCTAIAVKGVDKLDDAEMMQLRNSILKSIVNSKINADDKIFDEFYSFTGPYYGTYAMYEAAEEFFKLYPTSYDIGLLENGYYAYGNPYGFYMYNIKARNFDLEDYINAAIMFSEQEFEAKYGQYPVVMKKYAIIRNVLTDLGITF